MNKAYVLFFIVFSFLVFDGKAYGKDAGFWDFFFPTLRSYDEDPSKTLRAPFARTENDKFSTDKIGDQKVQLPSPDNTVALHKKHRVDTEIVSWLKMKIPDLLDLTRTDYNKQLQDVKGLFVDSSWSQYASFLKEFGVLQSLKRGAHDVRSYVEASPSVLTQDTINGRYTWLLRTPLALSFIEGNSNNYKDLKVYNRYVELTIQLGRHEDAPEPGVLIERWEVKEIEK